MIAFLIRRLFYAVPVLLGVALITLLLFNVASGDPARIRLGSKGVNEAELLAMQQEMGLQDPWYTQYGQFIMDTMTLNFGRSWTDDPLVSDIFLRGLGPTLSLSIPAFLMGTSLAIALSLLVAYFRGRPIDRIVTTAAIAGISVSSLVYILFGQWLLADQLKLFPIWGYEYGPRALLFLALPITIWILLSVGTDIRYYRTVALEEPSRLCAHSTARPRRTDDSIQACIGQLLCTDHHANDHRHPISDHRRISVEIFGFMSGSELYRSIMGSDFPVVKASPCLRCTLSFSTSWPMSSMPCSIPDSLVTVRRFPLDEVHARSLAAIQEKSSSGRLLGYLCSVFHHGQFRPNRRGHPARRIRDGF